MKPALAAAAALAVGVAHRAAIEAALKQTEDPDRIELLREGLA